MFDSLQGQELVKNKYELADFGLVNPENPTMVPYIVPRHLKCLTMDIYDRNGGLYKVKVWPQISQMYPIWPPNPKNASFVPSMLCLDILND